LRILVGDGSKIISIKPKSMQIISAHKELNIRLTLKRASESCRRYVANFLKINYRKRTETKRKNLRKPKTVQLDANLHKFSD
jgi:hypothetical protein